LETKASFTSAKAFNDSSPLTAARLASSAAVEASAAFRVALARKLDTSTETN